jgi:hypothetical protein
VDVHATPEAVALVLGSGGRLYVWAERSAGCQPLSVLAVASEPPAGREFARVAVAPFDVWLAAGAAQPAELGFDVRRGRVRATWDGAAWAI